jgi:hypothetical protein
VLEASAAPDVRDARERLLAAGEALRRRPRAERVQALGRALERLRAPGSAERTRLERELPEASGFSPAVVREGLARALAPFSAAALDALVERELGGLGKQRLATGFPLTAVLLGGGVPTPALPALAAPLALGSPVLARTSSHDRVTARVFAAALAEEDAELAAALALVSFPSDDDAALAELLAAPCVAAFGSDETMATIAGKLGPAQRFVRHGHRLSVAVLGEEALSGRGLADAAAALALDVALWDQQGCLSPVAAYALGAERVPDEVLAGLEAGFAEAAARWPRGRTAADATARFGVERDTAELRAAAGADVRVARGAGYVLVAEPDAAFRGSPLHRFLRIHPAPDPERLLAALAPLGPRLAAVGVAGLGPHAGRLEPELAALGAARICPLGALQAPPLDWCHDQSGVLLPIARLTDVEG